MLVFKKMCFKCGNKVDKLYNNLCETCYKEENPPIKEIKPINLKICNMCKKVYYNNGLFFYEEIKSMLPQIVEKNIILNEGFVLNSVLVVDIELEGNKIKFEVEVDCDLK